MMKYDFAINYQSNLYFNKIAITCQLTLRLLMK